MAVPYTFGSATSAIPLSQLDSNFASTITLGNTAIQLGNTVTILNNMTFANVTISSGSVTITNATVTNANVTTALTLSGGTANGVAYLNGSNVLTTGSALTFDGTNLGVGVTPSAWGSSYKAAQTNTGGAIAGKNDGLVLAQNCYFDGTNWINNRASTYSSRYDMNVAGNGVHAWYTYNGVFGTAGNAITFTQAMSVLASGELLIGKTAVSTSTAGLTLSNFSGTTGTVSCVKTSSGQSTAWGNFYSGTYVGGMEYTNSATIFATSSDVRMKKDIVDAPDASAKIDQIRIVSHGWRHADEIVEFGTIAQELYEIAPQAVTKGDDGATVEKAWGVDYSKLVPMLVKEIQSLRKRLAALESK